MPMSDTELLALKQAIAAPCQAACDAGHVDSVFTAICGMFAVLVAAHGLTVEDALTIHNSQVRRMVGAMKLSVGSN